MKRRKPKAERKETSIHIRVNDEQKRIFEEKAKRRGLGLSGWLISLGMTAPLDPAGHEK